MAKNINFTCPIWCTNYPSGHFSAYSIYEGSTEIDNIHSVIISNLELDSYNFPEDAELQLNIKCGKNDMKYVDLGTVASWSQLNEIFDFTESKNPYK